MLLVIISVGLVYRPMPNINIDLSTLLARTLPILYGLWQYQPYIYISLVGLQVIPTLYDFYININNKHMFASYQPKINLGFDTKTKLILKVF